MERVYLEEVVEVVVGAFEIADASFVVASGASVVASSYAEGHLDAYQDAFVQVFPGGNLPGNWENCLDQAGD